MLSEKFQLQTIVRVLTDGFELAEALVLPEISALGDGEEEWRGILEAKAKAFLEDSALNPTMGLHRKRITIKPEVSTVEIVLEPPKRSSEWQQAVTLRFPILRWSEEEDLFQAYVPALGIRVLAPRASLLDERIEKHIRLVLMGRRKKMSLQRLAQIARVQSARLGQLELEAKLRTPKELAASHGLEKEEASTLQKLAEELPPRMVRDEKEPVGSIPQLESSSVPPCAFEMEAELKNIAQALSGAHRRSVLLTGPAGSGKTALVRELARRRKEFGFGHTPFWTTSGARLMRGPIGFGMWQERCQKLCREAAKTNSILHLGNLGEMLEVGKARQGQESVGSFLRPWIARGEVLMIAECTPEQLGAIERRDPHLLDAFQQLSISPRTADQTRAILGKVFEASPGHGPMESLAGTQAALDRMHQLHLRYAVYSANPGRVIRFLKNLLADRFPEKTLTEAEVTAAFSRETGLPPVLLDDRIPLDLDATREWFASRVIGQPEAIARALDLLAVIKARLARPQKPLASFLFIGPTGTGKTELAKALAEFLFGDAGRLARFDLNQFNDPVSIQRLIGGPLTGNAEGLLTARVREQPFSVILLDEFEKADPGFFDLLLQILGDGRLTDAAGRVADFCNSVIVMTSNLGARGFQRGPSGFRAKGSAGPDAQEHFSDSVRKFLRPEIYNRLDAIVPFDPLSADVILSIAQRQIHLLRQRDGLRLGSVELDLSPAVPAHLARAGHDMRYGARPLKRALERELLKPLAVALTQYSGTQRLSVRVEVVQKRIKIDVHAKPEQEGEAHSTGAMEGGIALAITVRRRLISRLKNCSASSDLENKLTLGESLARRLGKDEWKTPEQQTRLASLPKIRECLKGVVTLLDRVQKLETDALSCLYETSRAEPALRAPELHSIEAEHLRLLREVFRLRLDAPNEIVIAIYSESKMDLLELASAYHAIAKSSGEVLDLNYIVPPARGRSAASKALREPPKKPEKPFSSVPENLVGVVMHLRGELFFPQFETEGGLQIFTEKDGERACLVETGKGSFKDYEPPAGIERQGTIKTKGMHTRRRFDREAGLVEDSKLGERPWRSISLVECIRELIEERLREAIQNVTS